MSDPNMNSCLGKRKNDPTEPDYANKRRKLKDTRPKVLVTHGYMPSLPVPQDILDLIEAVKAAVWLGISSLGRPKVPLPGPSLAIFGAYVRPVPKLPRPEAPAPAPPVEPLPQAYLKLPTNVTVQAPPAKTEQQPSIAAAAPTLKEELRGILLQWSKAQKFPVLERLPIVSAPSLATRKLITESLRRLAPSWANYLQLLKDWKVFCNLLDTASSKTLLEHSKRMEYAERSSMVYRQSSFLYYQKGLGKLSLDWTSVKRFRGLINEWRLIHPIDFECDWLDALLRNLTAIEWWSLMPYDGKPGWKPGHEEAKLQALIAARLAIDGPEKSQLPAPRPRAFPKTDLTEGIVQYPLMMSELDTADKNLIHSLEVDFVRVEKEKEEAELWAKTVAAPSLHDELVPEQRISHFPEHEVFVVPQHFTSEIGHPKQVYLDKFPVLWDTLERLRVRNWPHVDRNDIWSTRETHENYSNHFVVDMYKEFLVPTCKTIYTLHKFQASAADFTNAMDERWRIDSLLYAQGLVYRIPKWCSMNGLTEFGLVSMIQYVMHTLLDARSPPTIWPTPDWTLPADEAWLSGGSIPAADDMMKDTADDRTESAEVSTPDQGSSKATELQRLIFFSSNRWHEKSVGLNLTDHERATSTTEPTAPSTPASSNDDNSGTKQVVAVEASSVPSTPELDNNSSGSREGVRVVTIYPTTSPHAPSTAEIVLSNLSSSKAIHAYPAPRPAITETSEDYDTDCDDDDSDSEDDDTDFEDVDIAINIDWDFKDFVATVCQEYMGNPKNECARTKRRAKCPQLHPEKGHPNMCRKWLRNRCDGIKCEYVHADPKYPLNMEKLDAKKYRLPRQKIICPFWQKGKWCMHGDEKCMDWHEAHPSQYTCLDWAYGRCPNLDERCDELHGVERSARIFRRPEASGVTYPDALIKAGSFKIPQPDMRPVTEGPKIGTYCGEICRNFMLTEVCWRSTACWLYHGTARPILDRYQPRREFEPITTLISKFFKEWPKPGTFVLRDGDLAAVVAQFSHSDPSSVPSKEELESAQIKPGVFEAGRLLELERKYPRAGGFTRMFDSEEAKLVRPVLPPALRGPIAHKELGLFVNQHDRDATICRDGKDCKKGKNCMFHHPDPPEVIICKDGKNCRKGKNCPFDHPDPPTPERRKPTRPTLCKFGEICRSPYDCEFIHPELGDEEPAVSEASSAATQSAVRDPRSQKACYYGEKCNRKKTCPYLHPAAAPRPTAQAQISSSNTPQAVTTPGQSPRPTPPNRPRADQGVKRGLEDQENGTAKRVKDNDGRPIAPTAPRVMREREEFATPVMQPSNVYINPAMGANGFQGMAGYCDTPMSGFENYPAGNWGGNGFGMNYNQNQVLNQWNCAPFQGANPQYGMNNYGQIPMQYSGNWQPVNGGGYQDGMNPFTYSQNPMNGNRNFGPMYNGGNGNRRNAFQRDRMNGGRGFGQYNGAQNRQRTQSPLVHQQSPAPSQSSQQCGQNHGQNMQNATRPARNQPREMTPIAQGPSTPAPSTSQDSRQQQEQRVDRSSRDPQTATPTPATRSVAQQQQAGSNNGSLQSFLNRVTRDVPQGQKRKVDDEEKDTPPSPKRQRPDAENRAGGNFQPPTGPGASRPSLASRTTGLAAPAPRQNGQLGQGRRNAQGSPPRGQGDLRIRGAANRQGNGRAGGNFSGRGGRR